MHDKEKKVYYPLYFQSKYEEREKWSTCHPSCTTLLLIHTYRFVLFVNLYAIRYGDTVEQSTSTFPARFAPMILANRVPLNVWGGGGYIIGANRAEKVHIVFSTVSP